MNKHIKLSLFILCIFTFSIALRIFLFEVYAIPSSSMENTLIPGDKVVVNKLLIGPRLPQSPFEIPWVNLGFMLSRKAREKAGKKWWSYKRMRGLSEIKRNDILLFNHPVNKQVVFIKRCVALPGDTLLLKNADVYINGEKLDCPEKVRKRYLVYSRDIINLENYIDSIGLNARINYAFGRENSVELYLEGNEASLIENSESCDSVKQFFESPQTGRIPKPWIKSADLDWTIDFFGPLFIPSKGSTIELNYKNYLIYQKTIRNDEGHTIEFKQDSVYIDGKTAGSYTFRNNYYFMLGDNRYHSRDSRYMGLIPESRIIGKTRRVLFSNGDGMRWGRVLKKID